MQGVDVDMVHAVMFKAYAKVNNANLSKFVDVSSILFRAKDCALSALFKAASVPADISSTSSRNDCFSVGAEVGPKVGVGSCVEVVGRDVSWGFTDTGYVDEGFKVETSHGTKVGPNVGPKLGDTIGFSVGFKDGTVKDIGGILGLRVVFLAGECSCSADVVELVPLACTKEETNAAIPPTVQAAMERMTAGHTHLLNFPRLFSTAGERDDR